MAPWTLTEVPDDPTYAKLKMSGASIPDVLSGTTQQRAAMRQMRDDAAREILPRLMTSPAYLAATREGKQRQITNFYSKMNKGASDQLTQIDGEYRQHRLDEQRRIQLMTP